MKLLIVTQVVDTEDPILGFFHRWIEEFASHAEQVHVICLKEGKHSLPGNVHVHSLGKERGPRSSIEYAATFLSSTWKLRREYDHVFVHMNPEYVVLAGMLWRLLGKRVALWYTHKQVTLKLRVAAVLADVLLTASPESLRLRSKKKLVMGHGISLATKPRARESGLLVSVGRVSPAKRPDLLIALTASLARQGAGVRLQLVGPVEDSYQAKLSSQAAEEGIADRVEFLGPVSHDKVADILSRADVFLNVSETGSLDKAVLEAALQGVIPVTTNEGLKTFLDEHPELLAPRDDIEEYAKRVQHVLDLPEGARVALENELSEKVKREHGLPSLVNRIVATMAA